MVGAAVIGSAVVGGVVSSKAGSKAAKAQTQAAEASNEVQKYMYDTTRADYAPYRDVGTNALYSLADLYGVPYSSTAPAPQQTQQAPPNWAQTLFGPGLPGSIGGGTAPGAYATSGGAAPAGGASSSGQSYSGFYASPSYQFRLNEGLKAIERSAAARGGLRSGATMDALNRRAQDYASLEFDNYANRLASLAGVGQTATNAVAGAGQNYAGQVGQNLQNAGAARASSYTNTGNAINNSIQSGMAGYLYTQGYGG